MLGTVPMAAGGRRAWTSAPKTRAIRPAHAGCWLKPNWLCVAGACSGPTNSRAKTPSSSRACKRCCVDKATRTARVWISSHPWLGVRPCVCRPIGPTPTTAQKPPLGPTGTAPCTPWRRSSTRSRGCLCWRFGQRRRTWSPTWTAAVRCKLGSRSNKASRKPPPWI